MTASSSASASSSPSPSASNSSFVPPIPNNVPASSNPLTLGETAGISIGSIAAACIAGALLIKFSPSIRRLYIRQFGSSSKAMKKNTPIRIRNPVSNDVPITINHNPQLIIQQRLEQLREFQKQTTKKQLAEASSTQASSVRTKKEFMPVVTSKN
jgi:hypothetical protein